VPRGAGGRVRRRGFGRVVELDVGEEVGIGAIRIRATNAEHAPGRGPFSAKTPSLGYVLEGTASVYFAGDTDLFPAMNELAQLEQPVAHPPSRWYRNRWVKRGLAAGAALAVIVGTFAFVLPQFANYGDVWARVENLSWEWIAVLLATVALNVVTFTPPWMAA